jgi:hypothetical protein
MAAASGPPGACRRPFRFGRTTGGARACAGGGSLPFIGPKIHPNHPRKQGTEHKRNNLATRSVLTWYSSSRYPNYKRSILGPAVQVPQFLLLITEVTPQLFIHS